jgi:hypothetical protein
MPKIVCVPCKVEFVVEKTGVTCCNMFGTPPRPYELMGADAWRCPSCGSVVLAGFSELPFAQHFESDFKRVSARFKELLGEWFINCYEHIGDKEKYENG